MKEQLLDKLASEIREGLALPKCRKCGCMREALDALSESLPKMESEDVAGLTDELNGWLAQLEEQKYACAGCSHCYGAVAENALHDLVDDLEPASSTTTPRSVATAWPPMPGDYDVLGDGAKRPVAISTLGDVELAENLVAAAPAGVAIIGKTETENIGLDKLIKNTISNPSLRHLVLAGNDPEGHRPGQTLLALATNGVDDKMRVVGSEGRRPILKNVTRGEVEAFRKQVDVIDMIGTSDVDSVVDRAMDMSLSGTSCGCTSCDTSGTETQPIEAPERIVAAEPAADELDKAGYFVVIPEPSAHKIVVEHYGYDDRLLHTVEGPDARSIYFTAIHNGWLTLLSHAAYLGKELEKAELSMKHGFHYVQDGM